LPNPQAVGPPLVGCPRLLIQYIYHIWRPFLHPQPEDAHLQLFRHVGTLPLDLGTLRRFPQQHGYNKTVHLPLSASRESTGGEHTERPVPQLESRPTLGGTQLLQAANHSTSVLRWLDIKGSAVTTTSISRSISLQSF
jgi:hypothetical protein